MTPDLRIGDCREVLATLPAGSIDCCVTSPPYWGLRDYGHGAQIGLEDTISAYVEQLVEVFRQVRRVLSPAGTLWLNLGDTYSKSGGAGGQGKTGQRADRRFTAPTGETKKRQPGIRPKNLLGLPWRVAFALQDDGWYLRQEIIWHKTNGMIESTRDRPTRAHESIFLLSKRPRYFYDAKAIQEPATGKAPGNRGHKHAAAYEAGDPKFRRAAGLASIGPRRFRNARSVWKIAASKFPGAHFATFPLDLPRRCIDAGCPPGGTVLDPFAGAGTTGLAAQQMGRRSILIELNPEYAALAQSRFSPQMHILEQSA